MTGREFIIYILQNNLEDMQIIGNGRVLGFMTAEEAAIRFDVTENTIIVWCFSNMIDYVTLNGTILIPVNAEVKKKQTDTK